MKNKEILKSELEKEQPKDHETAKKELKDLLLFWDNLALWEREIALENIVEQMDETDIPMSQQIEYLVKYNDIEKASGTKPCSSQEEPNPEKKPHFEKCVKIIKTLSKEQLIEMSEYLQLNTPKLALMKKDEIVKFFIDLLGDDGTITIFFACRNFLGKHYI
jgi:hypothetical protein